MTCKNNANTKKPTIGGFVSSVSEWCEAPFLFLFACKDNYCIMSNKVSNETKSVHNDMEKIAHEYLLGYWFYRQSYYPAL